MKKIKWFLPILMLVMLFACKPSHETSSHKPKPGSILNEFLGNPDLPGSKPVQVLNYNGNTLCYVYKVSIDGNSYLIVVGKSSSYHPAITQIK
jgi:hypothetical protein